MYQLETIYKFQVTESYLLKVKYQVCYSLAWCLGLPVCPCLANISKTCLITVALVTRMHRRVYSHVEEYQPGPCNSIQFKEASTSKI